MSQLGYIEKLLDGVEVEWLSLDSVIRSLKTGLNPRKNFKLNTYDAQNYYVTVREIQNGKIVVSDKTDKVNNEALKLINKRSNLEVGDILFSGTGTIGRIAVVKEAPINWGVKEGVYVIKPNQELILPDYLAYVLTTQNIVKDYNLKIVGSPVGSLPMSELKKIKIPVPTLQVQNAVTRILDTFTELTAELAAELTARQQQYAYYREQLLTFEEGEIEWKTLGEVSQYSKERIGYEQLNEKNYVGVNNLLQDKAGKENSSHVPMKGNSTKYQENDILIGNIRPYLKKIWQADCTGGTNGDVLVIHITDEAVLPRYLYQILADDNFFNYNMQYAKGAKMPRGDKAKIMDYRIPIPPLDEQKRIVSILDKFDVLTTSLTEGLPREIELRQQQYEYYRDLLLSFPKPEVVAHD